MKRLNLLLVSAVMAFSAFAQAGYTVSKQEQSAMTEEAENWIDDMPDGIQDKLSDAVAHSLRGFFTEVESFRTPKDSLKNLPGFQGLQGKIYKGKSNKSKGKKSLLIYFHGGGWTMGSVGYSDKFCSALANEGNVIVVSLEYPLAPEYTYPSALDYCVGAVEKIAAKAKDLGSDASLVSLGGDGAGGNLALATYEKLPANVKVRSLVLYYPLLQTTGQLNPDNKRKFGRGFGFDSRLWESFVEAYRGHETAYTKKLPPTLLISAGRDIIIDQERDFSKKGINYVEFTGALHGFITDGHQRTAFKKAVELTERFLQTK